MMCDEIIGLISEDEEELVLMLEDEEDIIGTIELPSASRVDPYTGPYEFTPDASQQIISIKDLKATEDIIIDPIPSNYGLIAWDGITLRVS